MQTDFGMACNFAPDWGATLHRNHMQLWSGIHNYAAAHGGDSDLQDETKDFIVDAMVGMGVKPNNLVVDVKEIQLRENPAVQVTVSNEFPLFGVACGLPSNIRLSDTEVVSW